MVEILIYSFIFIVIVIFLIAYLKNNKVFEGLENSKGSSSSGSSSSETNLNITGVGAPSQLYDQGLTNAIASLDTELNMTTYSSQYLQIINNMRELYKRKALKFMLQTPLTEANPFTYIQIVGALTAYDGALKTLDTLEDFVNSSSKTTKLGMWG